jgi:hypothetical protein
MAGLHPTRSIALACAAVLAAAPLAFASTPNDFAAAARIAGVGVWPATVGGDRLDSELLYRDYDGTYVRFGLVTADAIGSGEFIVRTRLGEFAAMAHQRPGGASDRGQAAELGIIQSGWYAWLDEVKGEASRSGFRPDNFWARWQPDRPRERDRAGRGVPEPGTMALFGAGLAAWAMRRRSRATRG